MTDTALMRQMAEALRPFAVAAEECLDETDRDGHAWEHPVAMNVDISDFRRAEMVITAYNRRMKERADAE